MRSLTLCLLTLFSTALLAAEPPAGKFPAAITRFRLAQEKPIFKARGPGNWDVMIRERGWILKDGDGYKMWFTGYDGTRAGIKMLGYATSPDGVRWKRHDQPIYKDHWVEDMMVVKRGGTYYMFAEGRGDQAYLLTSQDGIKWKHQGVLDVRLRNGKPIPPGPYGTPTAWFENGRWYLFYERRDAGVWLATSNDMKIWTNVQDEPVLKPGPKPADGVMIALNQIVKYQGRYYALYHGTGGEGSKRKWSTCVATSTDLRHWEKYANNPLQPIEQNKSSGILVHDGRQFRLYTMHNQVDLHLPIK